MTEDHIEELRAQIATLTDEVTRLKDDDRYMTSKDAGHYLGGKSAQTMHDWRKAGTGPRFYMPTSKSVLYRKSDLDAWMARSMVGA